MSREGDLAKRCKALEEKVRQYEEKLQLRETEVARLKKLVATLAGQMANTSRMAEPALPDPAAARAAAKPEARPAPQQKERPAPTQPAPTKGDEKKTPAAQKTPTPPEPPTKPPAPTPPPTPHIVVPHDFKPGMFLPAVVEGEEDADEVTALLGRLDSEPPDQHHVIYERLTTRHRLMTNRMAERNDPDSLSWEKRLFMRYGMLDEKLMPDRMELWEKLWRDTSGPEDSGIYFVDEWLDAVAAGHLRFSSIDEIALRGEKPDHDATGEKALAYEIQNIAQMQRMCVGPRGNKITILVQTYCSPGPDNPMIDRTWLKSSLEHARKCDTLVCHRHYRGQDFEIAPLFIISPGYGEKGVCWEPYSPGKKGSTGPRICLTAFPPRGSMKALLMGLGDYRWEYAKIDARQYWMTEGLTGDWLSMFKPSEMKQDLKALFVDAYTKWVLKESQRIPTLDKRFREFMWRKAPFSDEIKENVKGSGVFNRLFELQERRKARDDR